MADVQPLLGPIKGMAQDYAREAMPPGFVWTMLDIIPRHQGGNARSRNGWRLFTPLPVGQQALGGVLAWMADGRYMIVCTTGNVYNATGTASLIGACAPVRQNPFAFQEKVIIPDGPGTAVGKILHRSAGAFALASLPASSTKGRYGCTYKERVVLAAPSTDRTYVGFSPVGDPTAAWRAESFVRTSLPLTGIFPLRNSLLCFHEAMTERIRGNSPPDSSVTNVLGDMQLEPFPDRVGCMDARTIAGWRENVIFADERGVHMTDGAISQDLAQKGGMSLAWRSICELGVESATGCTIGNFYLISVKLKPGVGLLSVPTHGYPTISGHPPPYHPPPPWHPPDPPPDPPDPPPAETQAPGMQAFVVEDHLTFLIEIPSASWTRLSNFPASCYFNTQGVDDAERLYMGADDGTNWAVCNVSDAIFPVFLTEHTGVDANGVHFRPLLETGYYPLAGARERIKNVYVGYELNSPHSNGRVEIDIATKLTSDQTEMSFEPMAKTLRKHLNLKRQRVPIRRDADGFALRFRVEEPFVMFNFFSLEAEGWPRSVQYLSRG